MLFSILQGIFWTIIGVTFSFFPMYLKGFGYSDGFIGIAMMALGVSCCIFQPLWEMAFDYFGSVKVGILAAVLLLSVSMFVLFGRSESRVVVCAFAVISGATAQSMIGVIDSWISKIAAEDQTVYYGRARGAGSVIFATVIIGLGKVLGLYGNAIARWIIIALLLAMAPVVLILPDPDTRLRQEGRSGISTRGAIKYLAFNRMYIVFTATSFLAMLTMQSVISFYPSLLASVGGTTRDLGISYAVMTVSEFLMMFGFSKAAVRVGLTRLYTIGLLGHCVKSVTIASAPGIPTLVLAFVFQFCSYGITMPGAVMYISEVVDRRYLATAQLIFMSLSTSLAQIIGNPVFGWVSGRVGVRTMLIITSIPAMLGALIFWWTTQKVTRSKTKDDVRRMPGR